ncbi:MAG: hypothetical protein HRU15_18620 [Planctomycetes bacterium]|nr:hypothetical protein [Planctomycetota bacterium]
MQNRLELQCQNWSVESLDVESFGSSYFENRDLFPESSVAFDCALLMRDIDHEWHSRDNICC